MAGDFKDYFSQGSNQYAAHRPTYPDALFAYLATISPQQRLAWDCATGNGQAALALAQHFDQVIATDASASQLDAATAHGSVSYRLATAEDAGLDTDAFDLVTVGQAFHWFDAPRFFNEAQRVLRRDGVLALWCYEICLVSPDCDVLIDRLYRDIVGDYWTPERDLVEQGYSSFSLPGAEIVAPEFEMALRWRVDDMLGYLGTWSAGRRYRKAHGVDPVSLIANELRAAWGDGERRVCWPLKTRISRPNTVD